MDLLQSDRVQKEASVNWLMLLDFSLPHFLSILENVSHHGAVPN